MVGQADIDLRAESWGEKAVRAEAGTLKLRRRHHAYTASVLSTLVTRRPRLCGLRESSRSVWLV
jgi:hypothetical protein